MKTGTIVLVGSALILGAVWLLRVHPGRTEAAGGERIALRFRESDTEESRRRVAYGWLRRTGKTGLVTDEAVVDEAGAATEGEDAESVLSIRPSPTNEDGIADAKVPPPEMLGPDERADDRDFGSPEGFATVASGTLLISRGKPVTSSDPEPLFGELEMITDGDKSDRDGACVQLGEGRQFVQIDLQGEHRIDAVVVWHYLSSPRVYHDVMVLLSDDPLFEDSITRFNNDRDNSSEAGAGSDEEYPESSRGLTVSGRGITARHVRLYSNGNSVDRLNHYVEVEVYGTPHH